MPRRRNNRRRSSQVESVKFPITLNQKEGEYTISTVKTIGDTFDRSRAFRIAGIVGRVSSYGTHAVPFYITAFGPVSAADTLWTSRVWLATPNGCTIRCRIPVTATGWYPSDTVDTTVLLHWNAVCVTKKTAASGLVGSLTLHVSLRPLELIPSCPTLQTGRFKMLLPSPPSDNPDSGDSDSSGDSFSIMMSSRLSLLRLN